MARFLLLMLLLWIALNWAFRWLRLLPRASRRRAPGARAASSAQDPPAKALVRCTVCGTHFPARGSVLPPADQAVYCSPSCRQAARVGPS
jgi:hypothetical protein